MTSSFFNSNNCSRSVLAKNWRLACNWSPALAKFACYWRPVACNMNKIGRNLHATCGHAGTISMRLAATRVQFAWDRRPLGNKTRDKQTKNLLYIIIIFFQNWRVHMLHHASNYSADGPWIFGLENALVLWMTKPQILHSLVASCRQSRHAGRTIFWIKKWDAIKKSENLPATCP
jgi:hypothetical protein